MKRCTRCDEEKDESSFHSNKRGLLSRCKDCTREINREWYNKNKEKKIKYNKKWEKDNIEKSRAYKRKYYYKNSEKMNETSKQWMKDNPEKHCKRVIKSNKKRYNNNPLVRLARSVRSGVTRVANAVKQQKELRSLEYLGCSLDEFKSHIESLWLEDMSWDNHGDWHIDHKIPLDWFVKNSDDPWKANHYSNLQPLWAEANLSKGNSL